MANVPIATRKVRPQVASIADKKIIAPLASATGAGPSRAMAGLGKAVAGVGDQLSKHIIDRQKEEADKEVLSSETEFRKKMQDVLYSTESDDKDVPKGLFNRTLDNAKGNTEKFDIAYAEIRKEFEGQFETDYQKNNIAALMDKHYTSTRGQVIRQEGSEGRQAYKEALDSNINQMVIDSSNTFQSEDLRLQMDDAMQKLRMGLKAIGKDDKTIAYEIGNLEMEMVENSIKTLVTNNAPGAERLLEELKDTLPKATYSEASKIVRGKKVENKGIAMYYATADLRLADGSPDYDAIETEVFKQKGYTPTELEQVLKDVRSKSREKESNREHKRQANKKSFFNELATSVKRDGNGDHAVPIEEARKLATKWSAEPYEIDLNNIAVDKAYSKDVTTDMTEYNILWGEINSNISTKKDIDVAYKNGVLSSKDYKSLLNHFYEPDKLTSETKFTLDGIELRLKNENGTGKSGKKKTEQIMYLLKGYASDGMEPEALETKAIALTKDKVTKGYYLKIWDKDEPRHEFELEKQQENAEALGIIYSDTGKSETNGIIKGYNRTKYKENPLSYSDPSKVSQALAEFSYDLRKLGVDEFTTDPKDIKSEFPEAVSDVDILKYGTPVHNVIMLLQENSKLVTPENIMNILRQQKAIDDEAKETI